MHFTERPHENILADLTGNKQYYNITKGNIK